MLYAWTLDFIDNDMRERYFGEDATPGDEAIRPTGVLLVRPDHTIAKEEILPALDYFHHRSGDDITLYCAGYGRHWYDDGMIYNDAQPVAEFSDSSPWLFSPKAFSVFVSKLKFETAWKYSGNPELVLFNIVIDREERDVLFDFAHVLSIDLVRAKEDKAFSHIHGLMEDIFRVARQHRGDLSVNDVGRAIRTRAFLASARDALLTLLPGKLGTVGKSSGHFVVHNKSSLELPKSWFNTSTWLRWLEW